MANWVEFLIAGVPTKYGGAGRVLIKFGNTASSFQIHCVYRVYASHLDAYGLKLGLVLANYTRMVFLVTFGGGVWEELIC